MALFGSYTAPGVFTSVQISGGGLPLFGSARIPVIIGEGLEYFTKNNVELFRGSSSVADEQVVNENISDQVTGLVRSFQTTYFPVTDGTGTGTVTNDPSKIQVTSSGVPVTVVSLNGATGAFTTQDIPPSGSDLEVNYFLQRGDTLITNESMAYQIPAYASLLISGISSPPTTSNITVTTTLPGAVGNLISIALVAGAPVVDSLAVSGYGTDTISINITKATSPTTYRTVVDLYNLINAGILTQDAGYLVASTPVGTGTLSPMTATLLSGGAGPNTNTTFKVLHTTIVDGTNGGVVTTNPSDVTVLVNGSQVAVTTVDGQHGLVTLATPVVYGSTLTISYYTNYYQNTSDLLPASNVSSIIQVGLGPDRADFIQDVDYVLGTDSNGNPVINWGTSTTTTVGIDSTGDAPFGASDITPTLVDEKSYLRYVGVGNGKTTAFTLPDVPTTGSGLNHPTDNPAKINVYVGTSPLTALQSGAVTVSRLLGASAQVTLYNPPAAGLNVYASYYRNTINDHSYTLTVTNTGQSGQGTYTIANEFGYILPVVSNGTNVVANPNFLTTGIVWPNSFADAWATPNSVDETVTLTFNNDGSNITPGTQATVAIQGVTFTATTPGTAANGTTVTFIGGTPNTALTSAVQTGSSLVAWQSAHAYALGQIVSDGTNLQIVTTPGTSGGSAPAWRTSAGTTTDNGVTWTFLQAKPTNTQVFVYITNITGGTLTTAQVAGLFGTVSTPNTGVLLVSGGSATLAVTVAATPLAGGTNSISTPFTHSFTVTSTAGVLGSHGTGYIDQTYIDATTGLKFTIVNPADALNFGYTQLPSPSYTYTPGDTLTFVVSKETARYTGSTYFPYGTTQPNNLIAIPGLTTKVATTYGSTVGDTAIVNTYNKSGNNPNVGEFYYVSFTVAKTTSDMSITLYDNPEDAYAVYGQPNTVNRLSLGIQLLTQNGAQVFGAIQVPKQTGLNTSSDSNFITAIQTLATNLPGQTKKADIIVPLSTSTTVHQFLSRQLITQATARYKGEGIGFVGYSQYTNANTARANARGLKNARMIAIGNPVAGLQITDSQTGIALEYVVSGEFMAAAMAGLNANPANDVATSLTLQDLVGFTRLLIRYDDATMNLMASDGLVLLTDNNGALSIRHYKSTDPSNPITSEPTSTTIADYTRQMFRADLQQYIGRKLIDSLVNDITATCNARLRSLVSNQIITGYKNLSVVPDANDPTVVNVSLQFKPMFSLLYINVNFTVTTSL